MLLQVIRALQTDRQTDTDRCDMRLRTCHAPFTGDRPNDDDDDDDNNNNNCFGSEYLSATGRDSWWSSAVDRRVGGVFEMPTARPPQLSRRQSSRHGTDQAF